MINFYGIGSAAQFPQVCALAECEVFLMPAMWLSQTRAGAACCHRSINGIIALALNMPAAIQVAASGISIS